VFLSSILFFCYVHHLSCEAIFEPTRNSLRAAAPPAPATVTFCLLGLPCDCIIRFTVRLKIVSLIWLIFCFTTVSICWIWYSATYWPSSSERCWRLANGLFFPSFIVSSSYHNTGKIIHWSNKLYAGKKTSIDSLTDHSFNWFTHSSDSRVLLTRRQTTKSRIRVREGVKARGKRSGTGTRRASNCSKRIVCATKNWQHVTRQTSRVDTSSNTTVWRKNILKTTSDTDTFALNFWVPCRPQLKSV